MAASDTKLFSDFPPIRTEQWEAVIQKDLKGADYAKKLLWQTDEGITVKPYYRSEDIAGLEYLGSAPGEFPFTRGASASADWKIREEIEAADAKAANAAARAAVAKGADEVAFSGGFLATITRAELDALVEGLDGVAIHFRAGDHGLAVLKVLADSFQTKPLKGSLDLCPVCCIAQAAPLGKAVVAAAPEFRPFVVKACRFSETGATTVQELGFGLAHAVEEIAALTDAGLTVEEAFASLFFSFATGSNYFFEIAKLRAARMSWARIAESFGIKDAKLQKAVIHSRTMKWNKTVYDPYVNLLRTTTEAMSAALGGADSISVGAFDETFRPADELSARLARNTQIILKKEAMLDRVVDPAAGSYYLETLTDSIAREAWKLFQQVEEKGGFRKAKEWVFAEVAKANQAKTDAIAARRRSVLGTNQYPNLKEKMLGEIKKTDSAPRGAQVFETLRLRTEKHVANGGKAPKFLLAEIGDLKMRKARSGFVTNFLGCGGFDIVTRNYESAGAAAKAAAELGADVIVLCSSDEEYPALAPELVKAAGSTPVIVAGFPKDAIDALKAAGVVDFVHIRSNAAATVAGWQQKLGVKE